MTVRTVAALFALSTVSFAQNWVEERTFVSNGQVAARLNGLFTGKARGKLGTFVWFQVQRGYSQGYGGVTFDLRPWMQVALGAGLEEAKNPARAGGYVWLGKGKSSILFIPEFGGSGFWWKLEANRKMAKLVGVGFMTERFKGSGPRLEIAIPRTRLKVWAAALAERRKVNGLFGIRWDM